MAKHETTDEAIGRILSSGRMQSRQHIYGVEIINGDNGYQQVIAAEVRAGGWADFDVLHRIDIEPSYQRGDRARTAETWAALEALDSRLRGPLMVACVDDMRASTSRPLCLH